MDREPWNAATSLEAAMLRNFRLALTVGLGIACLALIAARAQPPSTPVIVAAAPQLSWAIDDTGRVFRNVRDAGWQFWAQAPSGTPVAIWVGENDIDTVWVAMKNGDTYRGDLSSSEPRWERRGNVFESR
jgi:hypothetical protein